MNKSTSSYTSRLPFYSSSTCDLHKTSYQSIQCIREWTIQKGSCLSLHSHFDPDQIQRDGEKRRISLNHHFILFPYLSFILFYFLHHSIWSVFSSFSSLTVRSILFIPICNKSWKIRDSRISSDYSPSLVSLCIDPILCFSSSINILYEMEDEKGQE